MPPNIKEMEIPPQYSYSWLLKVACFLYISMTWLWQLQFYSTDICRGVSFHCNNRRCVSKNSRCNEIDNCGDGSDEPSSCSDNDNLYDYDDDGLIGKIVGGTVGGTIGLIVLPFIIIIIVVVIISVCAFKKNCPVYKLIN